MKSCYRHRRFVSRAVIAAALLLISAVCVQAESRVFTSNSGQNMKGELVSAQGEMVTIKREDGQVFTVKGNTFCKADQEYFREHGFRGAEPEKPKEEEPGWTNLLASIRNREKQYTIAGTWKTVNDQLRSSGKGQERIEFPLGIPAEYDYKVVFTKRGTNCVIQILEHEGVPFIWVMAVNGNYFFRYLDKDVTIHLPGLKDGHTYTSIVHVRNAGVTIELDGHEVFKYATDYQNAHPRPFWALRDKFHLGLGCADSQTDFRSAEMRPAGEHKDRDKDK